MLKGLINKLKGPGVMPIMNVNIGIADSKRLDHSPLREVVQRGKELPEKGILLSSGRVISGSDPGLISVKGEIDITDRLLRAYWEESSGFEGSDPCFRDENGNLIIGGRLLSEGGSIERWTPFSIYSSPFLNLGGLYNRFRVSERKGFFGRGGENIEGKIEFLENFLDKTDKSGYRPADMMVKNSKTRLRLLEQHYKRNISFYASK